MNDSWAAGTVRVKQSSVGKCDCTKAFILVGDHQKVKNPCSMNNDIWYTVMDQNRPMWYAYGNNTKTDSSPLTWTFCADPCLGKAWKVKVSCSWLHWPPESLWTLMYSMNCIIFSRYMTSWFYNASVSILLYVAGTAETRETAWGRAITRSRISQHTTTITITWETKIVPHSEYTYVFHPSSYIFIYCVLLPNRKKLFTLSYHV